MRKPLVAAFIALAIAGIGAAPAVAAPSTTAPTTTVAAKADAAAVKADTKAAATPTLQAVTLAGTVALSNCSGSVIRFPNSLSTDPALVLSNGHCLTSGFLDPGEVLTNQTSTRTFGLLNSSGTRVATLRASKLAYATMTDTDVSIYQLTSTYATIQSSYGISALTVQDTHPTAGAAITVASGYWKTLYNCNIDGFVYRLKEGDWTWKDSLRYTSACQTIGGTSGSPVIDQSTGKVVAVNNTGNEDGETCTENNPCEVDASGNVTVREGINYAQETYIIPACFTTGNQLNLSASTCTLPKP
ncbi:serine protease [Streptomyces sp. NBC_01275]|uniref:S1 family peptidase n=1 Tax=Streptomyces sp. NBC_01275 TaxID=2903807 RepID=UPI00224F7018|nr:serine protease [Streptomyces sp. NBC_01275]MCX4764664.1 serine protease [Streptomyces sp. NBC_01275]